MESFLAWTRKKDSKDRRESESNWQVGEKITILVSGVSLGLMLDAEPMFLKVIEWRRMVIYSLIISCNSKFQALVKNSFKIEKKRYWQCVNIRHHCNATTNNQIHIHAEDVTIISNYLKFIFDEKKAAKCVCNKLQEAFIWYDRWLK